MLQHVQQKAVHVATCMIASYMLKLVQLFCTCCNMYNISTCTQHIYCFTCSNRPDYARNICDVDVKQTTINQSNE